ncbi:uncharacterized protein LOC126552625 [Aphis gossypii]|uniref:uncharacterized protein LOC126552625 n=1 Tax=Aphis gossypii TaxID=80765 RepID=UPI002158D121|nr:uncharacterized protein LOC126552625 [Aphis gossypii]
MSQCVEYNAKKCRGRLHSSGQSVVHTTEHNHVADIAKVEAKEAMARLKNIAKLLNFTHSVLGTLTLQTTSNIAGQFPSTTGLKRTIQRVRKIETCRRARRAPLFSINVWNCYALLKYDIPRTNNSVEGWHNCFSSMLSSRHPSIWIFIDSLKKGESLNRLKGEQYIAGIKPPKKKKYKDSAIRLKAICDDYENRSINDYLRGISYNFQYQLT